MHEVCIGNKEWENDPYGWNNVNKGTAVELCKGPLSIKQ